MANKSAPQTPDTTAIRTTHGEPPDGPEINEAGQAELDRREAEASAQPVAEAPASEDVR
jgi:hypothetical protein